MFALTGKFQLDAHMTESKPAELTDGMLLSCGNHEIFRLVVLEYQPHALHIVFGITPVTQGRQVAHVEFVLLSLSNTGGGKRDLPGDERLAPPFALVIEQDARTAEHPVCLAVLLYDPVAVQFGHGIRAVWMKRRILVLRHLFHLPVQFRSGCLVNAAGIRQVTLAHGFQNAQHAGSVNIRRKFR